MLDAVFVDEESVEEGAVPLASGEVVGAVPGGGGVVKKCAGLAQAPLGLGDVAFGAGQLRVCGSEAPGEVVLFFLEYVERDRGGVGEVAFDQAAPAAFELADLGSVALCLRFSKGVDALEGGQESGFEFRDSCGAEADLLAVVVRDEVLDAVYGVVAGWAAAAIVAVGADVVVVLAAELAGDLGELQTGVAFSAVEEAFEVVVVLPLLLAAA